MVEPVRLAVVGTGQIGRQSHIPAALASQEVALVALVDPVVERAEKVAREFGIAPMVASRVEDVLAKVDAVVVATPNHTHAPIAVACLAAGRSVLIEKPLAHSYADGLRIVEAQRGTKAVLAVGYCTRFRDNVMLLKKLLDEQVLGRVRRFVHRAGTAGGWAPLSGYNLDRVATGGGVLVVTGSHFIDRMLYFWGQPDLLEFEDDSEGGPEANCRAKFVFSRAGIEGYAIYSKTVALPSALIVETNKGCIVLEDFNNSEVVFHPHGGRGLEQVIRRRGGRRPQPDVFRLQIEDFARAHREGRLPMIDGEQGLRSMKLIEDLYACRRPMRTDWYSNTVPSDLLKRAVG